MARFDRVIPPGGWGKIKLKVYTQGMSGSFKKYALVFTNDPDNPRFKLYLEGSVIPWVRIEPEEIVAMSGVVGSKMAGSVTLCPGREGELLEIVGVHNPYPDRASYELRSRKDGCYDLTITNRMDEPGSYFGRFRLETNHPEKKYVDVKVSCIIQPKVQLYPFRLHLGTVKKNGKNISRSVTVQSNLGGGLSIDSLAYNKTLFDVSVDESRSEDGRLYLTLVMDPRRVPEGILKEEVVLSFKERSIEPVTLTVLGRVVR